ncbi:MAG TPA: hypothetical protein VIU38_05680 [Anaerolineales bacterium]
MSRAWKWVLGILGVLIVVGLVAGAAFMWRNHVAWWGPGGMMQTAPYGTAPQQAPGAPDGYGDYYRYHMGDRAWRMPMMYYHGYGGPYGAGSFGVGFMILAALCRLLIPLGLLALVAYVFYGMGKRAGATSAAGPTRTPREPIQPGPARKVARR